MYSQKELTFAAGIIRQTARDNHVSVAQVRAEMMEAIRTGRSSPDPAVRRKWAFFQFAGEEPTPEEFILWAASQMKGKV